MNRWTDGRSGESGRYAGNLVLDRLDPSCVQIRNHKGTVFVSRDRCWIGRVVGDDSYLSVGVLHWANVSADQHRELLQFAREGQRTLLYLFITAHRPSRTVRHWQVPAVTLSRELKRRGKDSAGLVLGLHISDREGRHMLGEEDVTEYYAEFNMTGEASDQLTTAVQRDRNKKARLAGSDAVEVRVPSKPAKEPEPEVRRFEIPLSGGRIATLDAPIPMTAQDLTRVKGYIDLMSDLLVT